MKFFDKEIIEEKLNFKELIEELKVGFKNPPEVPNRLHYHYDNPKNKTENTLLFMPAWNPGQNLGVKLVTVAPENHQYNLGSIQGIYILFCAITGVPKALYDAKALTNWRTAAASALASGFLSREDSETLLMVGTGALAPYLIKAHSQVRPIKKVKIWGRNPEKAEKVKELLKHENFITEIYYDLEEGISKADIISCATLSKEPIIKGILLKKGQHLDMVGAYKPALREADDVVLERSNIYVDNLEMAPKETGDLAIPIREGKLTLNDIKGDLFELCNHQIDGRSTADEITLFKSVGHALEDLIAAQLVLNNYNNE